MTEETAIVKYKDKKIDAKVEQLLEESETITQADFYKVAGKTVPSARAYQYDANRRHISTRILEWGSDNEKYWVHVGGWIGREDNPIQFKDALVEISYDVLRCKFVLDKASKQNWPITRDTYGKPIFTKDEHLAALFDYMLNKKLFASREATTKAEAIVNKKLLSMEFREETEIESEQDEINAVREQKALQQRGHKRDTHTNTYGTDNKYGTVHKETKKPEIVETTYSINNNYSIEDLKDEKAKRDFLVKASNNKEHSLHDKVMKLLNGQNILDLDEKKMDGIIGILKIEMR